MSSFDFLWQMLDNHGVIERYKADCARLWDTYTLVEQRAIYRSIRDKLRAGEFVNYHPVKAVRDNAPKAKQTEMLTMAQYFERYGTTSETDGWHMQNPTGNKVIYVKIA